MSHLVHLAGTPVRVGSVIRQRCAWCGAVIDEIDIDRVAVHSTDPVRFVDDDGNPLLRWDGLVAIEQHDERAVIGSTAKWKVEPPDDHDIPEDSCMALPNEATA